LVKAKPKPKKTSYIVGGIAIYDLSPRQVLSFDVGDILAALAEDIVESRWQCRNVECIGGEALESASGSGQELATPELLELAKGVEQTIWGDFIATQPPDPAPWLVIRAIDSTCFEVFSASVAVLDKLRARFRDVREADPETNPY
jgi:hypothetical protein